MFEILSLVGIFLLTQAVKQYIKPKYGSTGVHVFVFAVAFVLLSIKGLMTTYPPFGAMVLEAGKFLVESLALYKVLLKPLNEKFNLF